MSTFEGTLQREDLGPGVWVLNTNSGERIALVGEVPDKLAGQRVTVKGQIVEGGMGMGMVGDRMVEVSAIQAA